MDLDVFLAHDWMEFSGTDGTSPAFGCGEVKVLLDEGKFGGTREAVEGVFEHVGGGTTGLWKYRDRRGGGLGLLQGRGVRGKPCVAGGEV